MRFERIQILNYRQYQNLEFKFPQGEQDIHVIIALNGVGKTNLLNAISWCLYRSEPHLGSTDKNKGLPIINKQVISECRKNGVATASVLVRIFASNGSEKLVFERILPVRITQNDIFPDKDDFSVQVSIGSDFKTFENDEARQYVERYMPESIRRYFFFDGEQLHSYFTEEDKDSSMIKKAIYNISQVDIVHRIAERLAVTIKEFQKDAAIKQPDIQKYQQQVEEFQTKKDSAEKNIQELENQIKKAQIRISEITSILQSQENLPELEEKYEECKKEKEKLETKRADIQRRLMSFVRERTVALTYYKAAQYAVGMIDQKRAENALPPNIDKDMLKEILNTRICTICGSSIGHHEAVHIEHLIKQFQVSSSTSNILSGMYDELRRIIRDAESYDKDKKPYLEELKNVDMAIQKNKEQSGKLMERLGKFPDKDGIHKLYDEREYLEELKKSNTKKQGAQEDALASATESLEKAKKDLLKAMSRVKECEQLVKMINFASDCQEIMEDTESDIMAAIREQMQTRTAEEFLRLIWKKNTYSSIVLSQDYDLNLFDVDGYSCVGTCSAAERCLLALAFTIALHEVSGFDTLLFIDTPVARVDGENRTNFAEALSVVSKNKQIIMTFTPDEYSDAVRKVFDPILTTKKILSLVDEKYVDMKEEA